MGQKKLINFQMNPRTSKIALNFFEVIENTEPSTHDSSSERSLVCEDKLLNRTRYDKYRLYTVKLTTQEHVRLFKVLNIMSDSYSLFGNISKVGSKIFVLVAAHKIADFTDLLKNNKLCHNILDYNFQHKIDAQFRCVQPKDICLNKFDWQHYYHLETIYGWMDKLAYENKYVHTVNIGKTFEGIPIKGIKICRNQNNPTVFIESGIHAREWIAPATATYIINELIFSIDPKIQTYSNCMNWIIFPIVNPDGYKYSFEKNRLWKKNRQSCGICIGVDINRNFPFHWNEIGSSSNPCSSDFSGTTCASENETKALIDFINANKLTLNIKSYISFHSFSQLLMFPYAYTIKKISKYKDLKKIAEKAVAEIKRISGQTYKIGSICENSYPSSGDSKDWAYAVANIPLTFSFELRGGSDLFLLPANEIIATGMETLAAILTIMEEGEKKGYIMSNKAILMKR